MNDVAGFSDLGDRYGSELARGLRLTGEGAAYFAGHRVERMREVLAELGSDASTILDFGCGPGGAFVPLRSRFPRARIIGFEPAEGLRRLAIEASRALDIEVPDTDTLALDAEVDVVCCNGVFHHVPVQERATAMAAIARALRDRGLLFAWENSPWNPGTRWVMSRISFDETARLIRPGELRALQRASGLSYVRTEYHFVFPHALRALRPLEPLMRTVPAGGQYVVVGERRAAR